MREIVAAVRGINRRSRGGWTVAQPTRCKPRGYPRRLVHVSAENSPIPDVLQAVHQAFYETQAPYEPTPTQAQERDR